MITAAEARTWATSAAEENKVLITQEAERILEEKVGPAIEEAIGEGLMSLAIALKGVDGRVVNVIFDKLSQEGFDVAVAAEASNAAALGENWFTVYWSKDRGGNPGNITRPKTVIIG